jgi:hypothetical protein
MTFKFIVKGTLLLTDQRLIFQPDKTKPGEHGIVQVTNSAFLVDAHYMALTDIAGVSIGRQICTIKVDLASGQSRHYMIMAHRLSPVWSKKSRSVREEAAEQINEAADEARFQNGGLPHSLGIETKGGRFTRLIRKGTPLPVSVTEIFTTADPNQPSIQIKPFQGEKPLAAHDMGLGLFDVTEIPPAGPGEPQIEVTFHVDASGAFSMTARDAHTGRDLPVLRS